MFRKYFKLVFVILIISCSCFLQGCFQVSNDDCNYRTVPVTNNPNNLGTRPSQPGMSY